MKRNTREDKRSWLGGRAAVAGNAAENGRNMELHSITNIIAGKRRRRE